MSPGVLREPDLDDPRDWPTFEGSGDPVTKDEIRAEVERRTSR